MKPIEIMADSDIRGVKMKKPWFSGQSQAGLNYNLAICILASGSRGNAVYISGGSTSILIDAGLSGIEIERRLKSKELCPEDLDAILYPMSIPTISRGWGFFLAALTCRFILALKQKKPPFHSLEIFG